MKKIIYFMMMALGVSVLSACGGTEDYDAYMASLKDREAAIDNITTPAEYADFVVGFKQMADSFASLDVKLNPTQVDEIKLINQRISQRVSERYNGFANVEEQKDSVAISQED